MALNEQERQIIDYGKANGKSQEQIFAALAQYRSSQTSVSEKVQEKKSRFQRVTEGAGKVTDFLGLDNATDVFGTLLARQGVGTDTPADVVREETDAPTGRQIAGAALQTAAIPAGAAITGGSSLAGQVAVGAGLGYAYDVGSDLAAGTESAEAFKPGLETAIGAALPPIIRGGAAGVGAAARGVRGAAQATPGVVQTVSEVAERVPRAIGRVRTGVEEATERAARIRTAIPEVRQAIKSGLDDVVVEAVTQADEPTKTAYRRMVELAEAPRSGLRPGVRPESVAGEVAAEQFDTVISQRKNIGRQIGEISDNLSKEVSIDFAPIKSQIDTILQSNGITPTGEGLEFAARNLTPQQQTVVSRLYELATQDQVLTPKQVHEYDQLFSKLQREARFVDQVDDVYVQVPTPEGTKEVNLFKVFRDVFSQKLDEVSPEMRELNRQYRTFRNLQDDLERSIFKSGNYDSVNVGAEDFAQTNLRRLFSDAQSAADYRALYDQLDTVSRSLGYDGARADDLAGFALRLRELYPETVPETSFTGGIRTGLGDIAGQILEVGRPGVDDQQKALKSLLDATTATE